MVSFVLTEESAVFQHYPAFMRNHITESGTIRSDSYISSRILHEEISDERITEFLRRWNRHNCHPGMIYVGCDSTNFNTEAHDIRLAEFGAAKDDPTKPQVNLAVAVKQTDSTPLYYDLFPGSIIDLTECEQLVEQMHIFGYKNVGLLFDRGYFSEANVRELDSCGLEFMMMLWKRIMAKMMMPKMERERRMAYILALAILFFLSMLLRISPRAMKL